jgi:hypothetical protein
MELGNCFEINIDPRVCHAEVLRSICVVRHSAPDPSRVRSG